MTGSHGAQNKNATGRWSLAKILFMGSAALGECQRGRAHLGAGRLLLLGLVVLEHLVVLLLVKQLLQAGGVEKLEVLQLTIPSQQCSIGCK